MPKTPVFRPILQVLYKIAAVTLLVYSLVWGLLSEVPRLPILNESIRMLYVHVPMWFTMIALYSASVYYALRYIRRGNDADDHRSYAFAHVGLLFGCLGLVTGMLWAKYTWGAAWSSDPKQNASALSLLLYLAYFILRGSVSDREKSARMSAIYNILGYAVMLPLIFVLPRLTDSLHPGNGGNPGFNAYDLDQRMRLVFYPAVLGWILLGIWLVQLRVKYMDLQKRLLTTL